MTMVVRADLTNKKSYIWQIANFDRDRDFGGRYFLLNLSGKSSSL